MLLEETTNNSTETINQSRHIAVYGIPSYYTKEHIRFFFERYGLVVNLFREKDVFVISYSDIISAKKAIEGGRTFDENTIFDIDYCDLPNIQPQKASNTSSYQSIGMNRSCIDGQSHSVDITAVRDFNREQKNQEIKVEVLTNNGACAPSTSKGVHNYDYSARELSCTIHIELGGSTLTEETIKDKLTGFGDIIHSETKFNVLSITFSKLSSAVKAVKNDFHNLKLRFHSMPTNRLIFFKLSSKMDELRIAEKLHNAGITMPISEIIYDPNDRKAVLVFKTVEQATAVFNQIRRHPLPPICLHSENGENRPLVVDYCTEHIFENFTKQRALHSNHDDITRESASADTISSGEGSESTLEQQSASSSNQLDPPPNPPTMPSGSSGSSNKHRHSSPLSRNRISPLRDRKRSGRDHQQYSRQQHQSSSRSRHDSSRDDRRDNDDRRDSRRDYEKKKKRTKNVSPSSESDAGSDRSSTSSSSSTSRRRDDGRRNSRKSKNRHRDSSDESSSRNGSSSRTRRELYDEQMLSEPSTSYQSRQRNDVRESHSTNAASSPSVSSMQSSPMIFSPAARNHQNAQSKTRNHQMPQPKVPNLPPIDLRHNSLPHTEENRPRNMNDSQNRHVQQRSSQQQQPPPESRYQRPPQHSTSQPGTSSSSTPVPITPTYSRTPVQATPRHQSLDRRESSDSTSQRAYNPSEHREDTPQVASSTPNSAVGRPQTPPIPDQRKGPYLASNYERMDGPPYLDEHRNAIPRRNIVDSKRRLAVSLFAPIKRDNYYWESLLRGTQNRKPKPFRARSFRETVNQPRIPLLNMKSNEQPNLVAKWLNDQKKNRQADGYDPSSYAQYLTAGRKLVDEQGFVKPVKHYDHHAQRSNSMSTPSTSQSALYALKPNHNGGQPNFMNPAYPAHSSNQNQLNRSNSMSVATGHHHNTPHFHHPQSDHHHQSASSTPRDRIPSLMSPIAKSPVTPLLTPNSTNPFIVPNGGNEMPTAPRVSFIPTQGLRDPNGQHTPVAAPGLHSPPVFNSSIPPPNISIGTPNSGGGMQPNTPTSSQSRHSIDGQPVQHNTQPDTPKTHQQSKTIQRPEKIASRHDSMSKVMQSPAAAIQNRSASLSEPRRPVIQQRARDTGAELTARLFGPKDAADPTTPNQPQPVSQKRIPKIPGAQQPNTTNPTREKEKEREKENDKEKDKDKEKEREKRRKERKEKDKEREEFEKKERERLREERREMKKNETPEERKKRKSGEGRVITDKDRRKKETDRLIHEELKKKEEKQREKEMKREQKRKEREEEEKKNQMSSSDEDDDENYDDSGSDNNSKKAVESQIESDAALARSLASSSISDSVKKRREHVDKAGGLNKNKKHQRRGRVCLISSSDEDDDKKKKKIRTVSSDEENESDMTEKSVLLKKKEKTKTPAESLSEGEIVSPSEDDKAKERERQKKKLMKKQKKDEERRSLLNEEEEKQRKKEKELKMQNRIDQERERKRMEKKEMKRREERDRVKLKEREKSEEKVKKRKRTESQSEDEEKKRKRAKRMKDARTSREEHMKAMSPLRLEDENAVEIAEKSVQGLDLDPYDVDNCPNQHLDACKIILQRNLQQEMSAQKEATERAYARLELQPISDDDGSALHSGSSTPKPKKSDMFGSSIFDPVRSSPYSTIISPRVARTSITEASDLDIDSYPKKRARTSSSISSASSSMTKTDDRSTSVSHVPLSEKLVSPTAKSSISSLDEFAIRDDMSTASPSPHQRPRLMTKAAMKSYETSPRSQQVFPVIRASSSNPRESSDSSESGSESSDEDEAVKLIEEEMARFGAPRAMDAVRQEPPQEIAIEVSKEVIEENEKDAPTSSKESEVITIDDEIVDTPPDETEKSEQIESEEDKEQIEAVETVDVSSMESPATLVETLPPPPSILPVEQRQISPILPEEDVSQPPPTSLISDQETADAVQSLFDEEELYDGPQYPQHDFMVSSDDNEQTKKQPSLSRQASINKNVAETPKTAAKKQEIPPKEPVVSKKRNSADFVSPLVMNSVDRPPRTPSLNGPPRPPSNPMIPFNQAQEQKLIEAEMKASKRSTVESVDEVEEVEKAAEENIVEEEIVDEETVVVPAVDVVSKDREEVSSNASSNGIVSESSTPKAKLLSPNGPANNSPVVTSKLSTDKPTPGITPVEKAQKSPIIRKSISVDIIELDEEDDEVDIMESIAPAAPVTPDAPIAPVVPIAVDLVLSTAAVAPTTPISKVQPSPSVIQQASRKISPQFKEAPNIRVESATESKKIVPLPEGNIVDQRVLQNVNKSNEDTENNASKETQRPDDRRKKEDEFVRNIEHQVQSDRMRKIEKAREAEKKQAERLREIEIMQRITAQNPIEAPKPAIPSSVLRPRNIMRNEIPQQGAQIQQIYPPIWTGCLAIKSIDVLLRLHYVAGNKSYIGSVLGNFDDGLQRDRIKINQRMRLNDASAKSHLHKIFSETDFACCIGSPSETTEEAFRKMEEKMDTNIIQYLNQKAIAGISTLENIGQLKNGRVHIFAPSQITRTYLQIISPELAEYLVNNKNEKYVLVIFTPDRTEVRKTVE